MKKVLFVATVVKKHISVFHLPYIKMFKDRGYKTFVAARDDYEGDMPDIPNCDCYVEIPFKRNPFKLENIKAYKMLKKLIDENNFDVVQCNTPVGGVLGRFAARKARKKGTKVVYIAHGFHFTVGGPFVSWLVFYPVEKLLSRITDILITINKEDYEIAKKGFKAKQLMFIHGIGVDLDKCKNCCPDKDAVRKKLGLKDDDTALVSIGELTERKNHKTVINAMSVLNNPKIHYVIMGSGEKLNELEELTESLNLQNNVHFLGFCNNVYEVLKSCDIFCFPSRREGLPVALMEAMAAALPVVVSKVRGNTDLIEQDRGGFLCGADDAEEFAKGIQALIDDKDRRTEMGMYNKETVKKYDLNIIKDQFAKIYFPDECNK